MLDLFFEPTSRTSSFLFRDEPDPIRSLVYLFESIGRFLFRLAYPIMTIHWDGIIGTVCLFSVYFSVPPLYA
jgi:hypothetical protein